ncbi:cytoplasmic protein [Subtercola boreus]|uniref:Cytoplasmic protein n=1 Tax=Subtercola boreus TaxID=120213 RepID=A0A3E0VVG3_9MICO|nr:MmcQ/YjbR family DNA-binding protein [Subtercola boreus]RFA13368.1 cytoplasmic protein [Subtercola boreus]
MDQADVVQTALRVAASFPAVTQGQPFGEGAAVFKVVGKVFAIVDTQPASPDAATGGPAHRRSPSVVTLKCAPPHGQALVREHPSIIPGYHMNKEHWISLCPGDDIDETLVEDLVGNSYDIIVAALPRAKRPGA